MNRIETTRCSGGSCVEIEDVGADWFRIRSNLNRHVTVAVTGGELRAFLTAVRAGQFDELARLEPDRTIIDLMQERDDLLLQLDRERAA